jgi:hypothetical protein
MKQVIARKPRNAERIFPFLGGEEVNDHPELKNHRYIINFGNLSEEEARRNWPDLMRIVEEKVRPERESKVSGGSPDKVKRGERWWQFARTAKDLYEAIQGREKALVIAQTSNSLAFAFEPTSMVFGHTLIVFAFDSFSAFGCLQSRVHYVWAQFFAATMKDDLRYIPTDCFATFPFPAGFETNAGLEAAGREYYEFRAALMVRNNEGLTKTYNRFHDPQERSPDIQTLRDLHARMDAAVLAAYGWTDLPTACDFILDYEEEEEANSEWRTVNGVTDALHSPLATHHSPQAHSPLTGRARKRPWRYRWPDEIRDEILARLLKLNAERAKEEQLAGLAGAAAAQPKPVKKRAAASAPGAKTQLALGLATPAAAERELPTDFRLPVSQPLLYTTNLVVTLLSEAGGSLAWPRLLDTFVLATNPKLMQRLAPAELAAQAKAWAARWNEKVPDGLLLPSLRQLGGKNLTVTEGNDGRVFHLLDGPRPPATEDVRYDAWLALRVAEMLTLDAVQAPDRAKWTEEANDLVFA